MTRNVHLQSVPEGLTQVAPPEDFWVGLTYLHHLVSASHFHYEIWPEVSILSVNRKRVGGSQALLILGRGRVRR